MSNYHAGIVHSTSHPSQHIDVHGYVRIVDGLLPNRPVACASSDALDNFDHRGVCWISYREVNASASQHRSQRRASAKEI